MTTQTPTPPPTDNERLARLEGGFDQMNQRLTGIQSQLNAQSSENSSSHDSLRNLMFMGFGFLWASMLAGFIAIFIAILNINP